MNTQEALGQIVLALAQPEKAVKIKAILADLEKSAYEQGYQAGHEEPKGHSYDR